MTRVTINHRLVRSAVYYADEQTMEVSFRNGRVMFFRGVPMKIYNDFMRASNRIDLDMDTYYRTIIEGKFRAREIKPARALA